LTCHAYLPFLPFFTMSCPPLPSIHAMPLFLCPPFPFLPLYFCSPCLALPYHAPFPRPHLTIPCYPIPILPYYDLLFTTSMEFLVNVC
jgi:hypothetical protein